MLLLVVSLFFARPAPLEMPKADAYLVREEDAVRLEDRYVRNDLWLSRTLLGRWIDDDDRVFSLFRLDMRPPSVERDGTVTRKAYEDELVGVNRRRDDLRPIVACLSPVPLAEKGRPPRQLPRGLKAVEYWQEPTNLEAVVCAFLPEKATSWFLATWELAPEDDFYVQMDAFEREFLGKLTRIGGVPERIAAAIRPEPAKRSETASDRRKAKAVTERELLRRDVRHDVALYESWHVTDAEEFVVVDDLPSGDFVSSLTNDLRVMRAKYAAALPTGLDGSNTLCVARIYADRDEYLSAIDEEMAWTAAYWNPERRELVAHLPQGDSAQLMKTIRHEAFHQYLSYATSMVPVSPWLNEGYAQYFEDEACDDMGIDEHLTPQRIDELAQGLPALMNMDYGQFYDGSDAVRRLKYRLAWSIARFLEKGADKVRFQPFKNLKRDYFEALLRTQDMRKATSAAFGSSDRLRLFVEEWKRFWKES